ncbi:MAG: hypothetical protein RLZZ618_161 [Pseudomonadota bacterium]
MANHSPAMAATRASDTEGEAFQFPVLPPLIARHAEDAGFYWSQLDASDRSTRVDFARFTHFNRLLDAHLEGLRVAGAAGMTPALSALQRWRGAGEAFACTWLVAAGGAASGESSLLAELAKHADVMLRGAVSALAWSGAAGLPCIGRWSAAEAPAAGQVAALRAAALLQAMGLAALASPLPEYFLSAHAPVRAAACRVAATAPQSAELISLLRAAMADPDMPVRAEAALALARSPEPRGATAVLWKCVADQSSLHTQATGWLRKQSARRLNRWLRHLAWLAPLGHVDLPTLFAHLPPRAGLTFALHHGDPAHLPQVVSLMADPATARHAGWVWQTLTGADLLAHGLVAPEPEADPDIPAVTEALLDADQGLPLPDTAAVRRWPMALPHGQRVLMGAPLTAAQAAEVINSNAPQALRHIAATALGHLDGRLHIHVRAPAAQQRDILNQLNNLTPA